MSSTENKNTSTPAPQQGLNAGFIDPRPDIAMLLGLFVARWSLAEMCLLMPLIVATNASQEVCAAMLAATNSAEGKIGIVRNAVRQTSRQFIQLSQPRKISTVAEVDQVLKDFLTLCQKRNHMMHHLWAFRSDGEVVTVNYRENDNSSERIVIRSPKIIIDAANSALSIAYRLCQVTGSPWVNDAALEAMTLKLAAVEVADQEQPVG